ncbi:hypothetical protein O0L34_g4396 [Tuta absoluta]|nr:hypothetical protein O0L34_g4396 [Tuta absoluta]
MFQLVALGLLLAAAPSWAEYRPLESPSRYVPPPPPQDVVERSVARNVVTNWITMPLDHFDPQNPTTFQMRYMYNEDLWGGEGYPIFIMVGGEWAIVQAWLQAGNMFQMAQENKGYMFYTEHRYYGGTRIFNVFNAETLRFLNVDQALADLAYFITELKKQPRFAKSEVILYGGSYAANMALWFKKRYPHLVKGSVASSGPIKGKADFYEYLEVVHEAFRSEGGQDCVDIIKQGIDDAVALMETEEGRRLVEAEFSLCSPLNYDNLFELGYFSGFITWSFSGAVQQARPGTLRASCDGLRANTFGFTPMQKVAGFVKQRQGVTSCISLNYENYVQSYQVSHGDSKAWYYQTCTEYGFYQTAPTSGTAFDSLKWINMDFYIDLCKQIFDPRFDIDFVNNAVDRVNLIWGGLEPNVNNTINIHGTIDPWHALGVHETDITDSSPTITVPRASHCFDMQSWLTTDTIKMSQAQATARRIVRGWLGNSS